MAKLVPVGTPSTTISTHSNPIAYNSSIDKLKHKKLPIGELFVLRGRDVYFARGVTGSTYSPLERTSKCRCGSIESSQGTSPTLPSCSPARMEWSILTKDVRRKSRIGHHIFAAGHLDNISPHRVVAHGSDDAVARCPDRFSGFCADVDAVVGAPVAQCFIFHQHISAEWGDGSTTDRQLREKSEEGCGSLGSAQVCEEGCCASEEFSCEEGCEDACADGSSSGASAVICSCCVWGGREAVAVRLCAGGVGGGLLFCRLIPAAPVSAAAFLP